MQLAEDLRRSKIYAGFGELNNSQICTLDKQVVTFRKGAEKVAQI
jgi:hypothetical protein